MTDKPLPAHSLAEIHLYFMATPCPTCGKSLRVAHQRYVDDHDHKTVVEANGRCSSCDNELTRRFELPASKPTDRVPSASPNQDSEHATTAGVPGTQRINPTDARSEIIDVAQWIVLFRTITEAAARMTDKQESRLLGYEAAQCLEEALKFYEPDNDLPPDDAFFHDWTRRRRLDHPEQFSRQRLVNLRAKLPTLQIMEKRITSDRPGGRSS